MHQAYRRGIFPKPALMYMTSRSVVRLILYHNYQIVAVLINNPFKYFKIRQEHISYDMRKRQSGNHVSVYLPYKIYILF